MRIDYPRQCTPALTWLVCALLAGFLLQLVARVAWPGGDAVIEQQLGLTTVGLQQWHVWTILTHGFLHDSHYFFHALGCLTLVYFVGRELLPLLRARSLLALFFAANAIGAIFWALVHRRTGGMHLGSMAAACAFLAVFAFSFPDRRMDFLVLFVPVSLKPKHLAWLFLGLSTAGFLFFELGGGPQPFGRFTVASSAHLGGFFAGWLYHRFVQNPAWPRLRRFGSRQTVGSPAGLPAAELDPLPEATATRADLRGRVDRILDKINSDGFGSLTAEEKRLLDEARHLLSRH